MNLDLKLQLIPAGAPLPLPSPQGLCPSRRVREALDRHPSANAGSHRPPHWAPKCPFSGLSLTLATSCLPFAPSWVCPGSSVSPSPSRRWPDPGVCCVPHPRAAFLLPNFRKLAELPATRGQPRPGIRPMPCAPRPGGRGPWCPWPWARNTMQYRLPLPFLRAHVLPPRAGGARLLAHPVALVF